jgi:hypothetical protein
VNPKIKCDTKKYNSPPTTEQSRTNKNQNITGFSLCLHGLPALVTTPYFIPLKISNAKMPKKINKSTNFNQLGKYSEIWLVVAMRCNDV